MTVPNGSERPSLYEVVMYDADTDTKAFLVIDRLLNGVAAGGIRMTPEVTLHEIKRLAQAMTYKFGAVKVAIGGAKSGIVAEANAPDKQIHLSAFAKMAKPFLKEFYIAGEDLGTTAEDLDLIYRDAGVSWIQLAKEKLAAAGLEVPIPDDFDPTSHGGENFEESLTGHGLAEVTEEACAVLGMETTGTRVVLQGFGTVGSMTAHFLSRKGFRLVGVADIQGMLYRPQGLPLEALISAKDAMGHIDRQKLGFEYTAMPREQWLEVEADILIPAAVADAIHLDNVSKVQAGLVVEGANIPVTEAAEDYLFEQGKTVVPDFIANAGAAGGFGMMFTGQVSLEPAAVMEALAQRLRETTREVLSRSRKEGVQPRHIAIKLAESYLQKTPPLALPKETNPDLSKR